MNLKTWIALVLIVLGIVGIVIETVPFTTEETKIEAGPVKVEAESTERVRLPLYGGIAAIVIGVGLLLVGRRSG